MRRHNQFLQFSPNISVKTSSTISPDDPISSFCIILYWLWPLLFNIPMNLHCSQTALSPFPSLSCLISLWIYITLKLYRPSAAKKNCLISLWIYIALKPFLLSTNSQLCLISLWIYIALKPFGVIVKHCCSLISLWIYIALKHFYI